MGTHRRTDPQHSAPQNSTRRPVVVTRAGSNQNMILTLTLHCCSDVWYCGFECCEFGGVGKLGHGDTSRVYKPKVVESLAGTHIRKVVCSGQSSTALTSTGQV